MSKTQNAPIPQIFEKDIRRAVEILKEEGCSEIYLFGSGVKGKIEDGSDLDLAVRGCPPGYFFRLLGRLLWELDHSVDLVNLDTQDDFAKFLQNEGLLTRLG